MENNDLILKLNQSISLGLKANKVQGFEKAFVLADATGQLQNLLSTEYMKPIMALQGNRLGFKTDKDNEGGYPEKVVKNCIIEAVLTGVQVVGNQFNVIAGNCYITKEGFGFLLNNMPGLNYEIIPQLPRINNEQTSAAIKMLISWNFSDGEKQEREIDFPIRMNKFMGVDAIIGKATRKARKWLYERITGLEIADGDITDVPSEVLSSKINTPKNIAEPKSEYKSESEVQQDVLRGALTPEQASEIIKSLKK